MFENVQKSFNGMFGKTEPGKCRLTMNGGIAVQCSNGQYKTYNVKKGTLTNVTNFCFNIGDEMFFVIPTWVANPNVSSRQQRRPSRSLTTRTPRFVRLFLSATSLWAVPTSTVRLSRCSATPSRVVRVFPTCSR